MKEYGPYLVSIIMPTYNRAGLILQTIESVLAQTYTNWELIIVDDGSEDNTEEIVNAVNDERVQFHKAGRIAVGSKIKNIGLSTARGKFIAFIDSDDLWAPTKLEKQLMALTQHPDARFSLTNGYNFRNLNDPLEYFYTRKSGIKYGDVFTAFFKSEVAATVPTLLLEKECLQKVNGFNESMLLSDVDFILNLARHFKAVILYEPLFYRRLHDKNYSTVNWIKRQQQGLELIRSYKELLPRDLFAQSLFKAHIRFGERYLRSGEAVMAINQFLKAWKHKPISIIPLKKTAKALLFALKK